jgi:Xaa-Pro aminopeptidase
MSAPLTPGDIDFAQAVGRLHTEDFGRVANSPWYTDAVYERFSDEEYRRRWAATQDKMARLGLDVLIACGGPNHWSWGSGMRWLSNHWEWHGVSAYTVVPAQGEPVLVCGPGGAHREAVRRASPIADVRHSRWGKSGAVIADLVREWGQEAGRIGLSFVDPVYENYLPVDEYERLTQGLPGATLERVGDFFHDLIHVKSAEELECVRQAGRLMDQAFHAMVAAARPGVTEYQLAAAASAVVLDGGGQIDFNIIGSTSMADPRLVFGNPWPSGRRLQRGDIVINELACGVNGYSVQIGSPICIGEPTPEVRSLFDDVVIPGYDLMAAQLRGDRTWEDVLAAAEFYRTAGVDSRPLFLHCIDLISHNPHVMWDHVQRGPAGGELMPGVVAMLEPTIIAPHGRLGIFFGRTYIITDEGHEEVTRFPHELIVV